ncbi:MAG: hypothetical protein LUH23_03190 [Oscillospiraceae bacterium]|nr:hypothetical protein [Oscillospiraceae bacterium]
MPAGRKQVAFDLDTDALNICMRDCRETNIGREHDKNHIFDKTAEVKTREELKGPLCKNP